MATNIPLPGLMGESFLKGMDSGSSMFQKMMQPRLEREKQKQQEAQHAQDLAFKQQDASRMGSQFERQLAQSGGMNDLRRKLIEEQIKHQQNLNDPNYKRDQMLSNINALQQMQNQGQPAPEQPSALSMMMGGQPSMGQGQGMMADESPFLSAIQQDAPQEPNQPQQPNNGFDDNMIKEAIRQMQYQAMGVKAPAATKDLAYQGVAREASDLERLKTSVGEDSPIYKNAKDMFDSKLDAKSDLRDLRGRTKAGLKPGEKEFFDDVTGEPLGKEIPFTEKERDAEQGNSIFNSLYPSVYKGAAPFSGEGSIDRLQKAFSNYKTDAEARKLVDALLLSDKAMAAAVVNEASTLKAGKTNQTYRVLKESLESQDVPKLIKRYYKEYKLPPSASLKASMSYQKLLSDARIKARKDIPATQKFFYNPELQAKNQEDQESGDISTTNNKIVVVDPNGKRFETTKENAKNLPEGWSRG